MSTCKHCGQSHSRDVTLFLNGEQYTVIYESGNEDQVVKVLEGWADDPELSFTSDAAYMMIGQLICQ